MSSQRSALNIYTEIVTYTVTAEQQQEVFDILLEEMTAWMRLQPGFLRANCHCSEDGTRVVNYIEWSTRADWQNSLLNPEQETIFSKIQAISEDILTDHHNYNVLNTIEGSTAE